MKQTITIEQLNELSEKGKERLREWWKPEDGDWCAGCPHNRRHKFGSCLEKTVWYCDSEWGYPDELYLPLLSIGQLIDFLDEQGIALGIEVIAGEWDVTGAYWKEKTYPRIKGGRCSELCDALWEAVKEVLEREI